ncbi:hypothetical protein SESBI_39604 [Sesbania bispinosa]|nr:hypothetical protein SESBI_39604 [Sesbania bispinosa]
MGMKSTGEEIVQVQGGHIVRSTGRKDRHSKVYTAKGPPDRRVRLSAHTAIQFYDVEKVKRERNAKKLVTERVETLAPGINQSDGK